MIAQLKLSVGVRGELIVALEIERKWLVPEIPVFKEQHKTSDIKQGYILNGNGVCLRVRVTRGHDYSGYVTVKGPNELPEAVEEHEMAIPVETAEELLKLSGCATITKKRTYVRYGGLTIELDEFKDNLKGLVVAEVEFPTPRYPFNPPSWFGKEVTGDKRYTNSNLVKSQNIPE